MLKLLWRRKETEIWYHKFIFLVCSHLWAADIAVKFVLVVGTVEHVMVLVVPHD